MDNTNRRTAVLRKRAIAQKCDPVHGISEALVIKSKLEEQGNQAATLNASRGGTMKSRPIIEYGKRHAALLAALLLLFFLSADATGTPVGRRFSVLSGVATDSAGNVYVADAGNHTIRKIAPAGVVTALAGTAGSGGSADGTGAAARFNQPFGIATDSAGKVYVADNFNQTIGKMTPVGVATTRAGTAGIHGSADGTGAAGRFNSPEDVATDSAGNVYVADNGNNTVRKITPAGEVSTIVGVAGQMSFAPGALPGLQAFPRGVTVSGTSLYIILYNDAAVVQNRP